MQKRFFNTWTIVFTLALLTGILSNHFFLFGLLASGTIVAMGLTVIGFILDLILKSSKGIRLPGFIFLFFVTATITSLTTIELSRSRAENHGNKVVQAAYRYKSKHGHFPNDIRALDIDSKLKAKFAKRNFQQNKTFFRNSSFGSIDKMCILYMRHFEQKIKHIMYLLPIIKAAKV
ncbi:MAG: hypothetical protein EOP48_05600 [Sphingobacteriales bacterium]|nr:MAG: hypothetical protein EOP48_05600 [Sphingobacteriales bacterium]